MHKIYLIIHILIMTFSFKGFGQQSDFKLYKGDNFEITYPQKWTAGKDGKVYNFYLNENLGDISVSVYKNSNLAVETVKSTILDLNTKRKKSDMVVVLTKGKIVEYNYEYIDDGVKWIIKGVQTKGDFFLVTLNWNLKDWEEYKTDLMKSFNSFKLK